MRSAFLTITVIFFFFLLFACGRNGTNKTEINSAGKQTSAPADSTPTPKGSKMLVAYFSLTGNTRIAAEKIHSLVKSDIFEIKTVETYPQEYRDVVAVARKELAENARPKLASAAGDMSSYDVVFVGYPNWCGTMPMAVFTFLESADFSGKTIVPFCTHGGSRLANSVDDIRKICPNSTILKGLAIRGNNVNNSQKEISEWLHEVGVKSGISFQKGD